MGFWRSYLKVYDSQRLSGCLRETDPDYLIELGPDEIDHKTARAQKRIKEQHDLLCCK